MRDTIILIVSICVSLTAGTNLFGQELHEAGRYDTTGIARDLIIHDEYAYIALQDEDLEEGCGYLVILDISDPENPEEVGRFDLGWRRFPFSVLIDDGYAFVTASTEDDWPSATYIFAIDISDFDDLEEAGRCDVEMINASNAVLYMDHIIVSGNWGGASSGLHIIDISDPTSMEVEFRYNWDPECVDDVFAEDNLIYTTWWNRENDRYYLRVSEASDLSDMVELGVIYTPNRTNGLFVFNSHAYLFENNTERYRETVTLRTYDVSDPESIEEGGEISWDGLADNIFIAEGYAYIGGIDRENREYSETMRVVNVSEPDNPEEILSFETGYNVNKIMTDGDLIYTVNEEIAFTIFDRRACISVFPDSMEFDTVSIGQSKEMHLEISVMGFVGSLTISEMLCDNNSFNVEFIEQIELFPGDTLDQIVTFIPDSIAEYNASLTIISDDPYNDSLVVHLNGLGIVAGAIEHQLFESIPANIGILQIHPNPFNSSTTISYELPRPGNISIQVYNPFGQRIMTIFEGTKSPGIHTATLSNADLPSGLYFVKLEAGGNVQTRKLVLTR